DMRRRALRRRVLVVAAAIVLAAAALGLAGCGGGSSSGSGALAATSVPSTRGVCGARTANPVKPQHVVWIVMENQAFSVVGSHSAPYLTRLAAACGLATRFTAEAHPSLPNYLAITSGSTQGVTNDNGTGSHRVTAP